MSTEYSEQDVRDGAILLLRALALMTPGMTLEDGLKAVLERDQELWLWAISKEPSAQEFRTQMSNRIYHKLRNRGGAA